MKELAEFIRRGERFAVISHVSPDGDTMGSAAALLYALEKAGKKGQWFCEGNVPADYMKIPELASLVTREKLKDFDAVIAVDTAAPDRLGNCRALFESIPARAVLDHHVTNTRYGNVNAVFGREACAFLVMNLLDELNIELDDKIARALFVGIMTDTGRLSHAGVTVRDVQDTARLYDYDIRVSETIGILFQTEKLNRTRLKGRAIEHIAQAFDGKMTYTYLENGDYAEFSADHSDSESVVEICRGVEGTEIAVFLRAVPEGGYKVSMRCREGLNVAEICRKFDGGGHVLAAGCTIREDREKTITLLKEAIREATHWKA